MNDKLRWVGKWGPLLGAVAGVAAAVWVGWRCAGIGGAIIGGVVVALGIVAPLVGYALHTLNGVAETRVIVVQTIVLTVTLLAVGWYALEAQKTAIATWTLADWAKQQALETGDMAVATSDLAKEAREQAEATHRLAEAALADRATLLVEDNIKTVKDYLDEGRELKGLTDDESKYEWLVIEIKNGGKRTAWNVFATAHWEPLMDGYEQEGNATNVGEMKERVDDVGEHEGEYKGKLQECWRVWEFKPDKPRFLYFPPPPHKPTKGERKTHVRFLWYDPVYYGWRNQIRVFRPADKWHTSWDEEATPVPQW